MRENLPKTTFEVPLRGIKAEGLDISEIDVGLFVSLSNEPNNPVDENAVVVHSSGRKLGYIPKDIAARMDPGEWEAVVIEVLEFEGEKAGIRLQVRPRVAIEF